MPIPAEYAAQVREYREHLMDALSEVDEKLMEQYLEDKKLDPADLRAAVRAGTLAMKHVPVVCGASFKNKGVQPLLDAVVDYLPSPLDIPPMEGINPETMAPETRLASDDEPFTALAFKLMNDPFVGQLDVPPRLRGHARVGHARLQLDAAEEGADRTPAPDAREQA